VDPEGLDEFVHAAGGDPGEVAVRDDRDRGGLGSFAALDEPLGKYVPERSFGVATSMVPAFVSRSASASAEERVDQGLQHGAHQIRGCVGQGFAKKACRVDNMRCGHRDDAFRVEVRDFSKVHTVTAPASKTEPATASYTTF